MTEIGPFKLVQTCGACPEQYHVLKNDKQVGYLRLRHGWFYAECGDTTVYEGSPKGDGIFEPNERSFFLYEAIKAIEKHLEQIDND